MGERDSAHGQWETGAPSKKTGAGDYFKLIVKILGLSSPVFLRLEMIHGSSELLERAVKTWAKSHFSGGCVTEYCCHLKRHNVHVIPVNLDV